MRYSLLVGLGRPLRDAGEVGVVVIAIGETGPPQGAVGRGLAIEGGDQLLQALPRRARQLGTSPFFKVHSWPGGSPPEPEM
jgi:hypothetical protein